MKQIELSHQKKLFSLYGLLIIGFSIIFLRLVQLQIIEHKRFVHIGEKNFIRMKMIPAQRGSILDCNGIPLATNKPTTRLLWQGTGNQSLNSQQKSTLENIKLILHKDIPEKSIKHAERFSKTVAICDKISSAERALIAEQCSDTQNITFENSFERYYPFNTLACHVLGYLGDAQLLMQGKMGLEKLFEDALKGEPGLNLQHINSFGTLLKTTPVKNQSTGQDLKTTIDMNLQKIAEEAMESQESGAFILLNPKTGHIPALVSLPNFEPSIFSQKISAEQWDQLQKSRPFVNKAFNAAYPPASIFKLVTIAAALEEGIVTPESTFNCKGYSQFKKRKYYCNRHYGHGIVTLQECLTFSCNIPCYEIAQKMPIDTLASYAFELGLGNKTDSVFTEKYGLVPTNEWKIAHKGEKWWTGETLSATLGQSFLLVTPIQVACMIGALFEGYRIKPQILHHKEPQQQPLAKISNETREFIQESMKSVITSGTGKRIKKFDDLTIYAKTGTAQTIEKSKRKKTEKEHSSHAWFVSYFYTPHTEPLVMVILHEHTGGSRTAVKVAQEFFKSYKKLISSKNQ